MSAADILRNWVIDPTEYNYVADKGPALWIEQEHSGDETQLTFHTFRLFAFKIGHVMHTGLPGRYLVNTAADTDDEEPESAMEVALPNLVQPTDLGQPPVIGLYWKVKANGAIYAQTIPTDLHLCTDSKTAEETWLTDEACTPLKLDLVAEVKPLAKHDGKNLVNTFDTWIKNNSDYFKERALRSAKACRAWLTHSSFSAHFHQIMTLAKQRIRGEVWSEYGLTKGKSKGQSAKAASEEAERSAKAEWAARWAAYERAVLPFHLSLTAAAVPVGHRIVEVPLPFWGDGELSDGDLLGLLKEAAPDKAQEILDLVKDKAKFTFLRNQEAESLAPLSPYPVPNPQPESSPAPSDAPAPAAAKKGKPDGVSPIKPTVDLTGAKRARSAPTRLGDDMPRRIKKGKQGKAAKPEAPPSTPAPADRIKRRYNKTGNYTKDKLSAVKAKAAGKSPPLASAPAAVDPAPPPGQDASKAAQDGKKSNSNSNSNSNSLTPSHRPSVPAQRSLACGGSSSCSRRRTRRCSPRWTPPRPCARRMYRAQSPRRKLRCGKPSMQLSKRVMRSANKALRTCKRC